MTMRLTRLSLSMYRQALGTKKTAHSLTYDGAIKVTSGRYVQKKSQVCNAVGIH